jgi:hypothetical protein
LEERRGTVKRDDASQGFFITGAAVIALLVLMVSVALAEPGVIKYTPNMTVKSLAGRPDADLVELKNGRRVSVGDLRRLDAAAQKMRAPRVDRMPAVLKVKPTTTGIKINNAADLAAALKLPDSTTVQLPSGRLATVGQIKLVQPLIEKRLGHSLTMVLQRPNLSGPAIKVNKDTTRAQWEDILKRPDNTVLESPNGKRITVGEAKQYLAKNPKAMPSAAPALAPRLH